MDIIYDKKEKELRIEGTRDELYDLQLLIQASINTNSESGKFTEFGEHIITIYCYTEIEV